MNVSGPGIFKLAPAGRAQGLRPGYQSVVGGANSANHVRRLVAQFYGEWMD